MIFSPRTDPTVSVCFPWRPDNGLRDRIAQWTLARWAGLFPSYELMRGVPDPDTDFNRSQGINNAFRASSGDVIIVADLDVIFHERFVKEAVERARMGEWGFGFRGYYNITQKYSEWVLRQDPLTDFPLESSPYGTWGNHTLSGLVVISREGFIAAGGFDEGFVGWGYEDDAFTLAADTRWSPHFRVEDGYVLHIWHPPASDSPGWKKIADRNRRRFLEIYGGESTNYPRCV